jgi:SAM-dependent methyltransferase
VKALEQRFSEIYKDNAWGDPETVSGGGSRLDRTAEVREILPVLLKTLKVKTLLDAGCGDWNWMSTLDLGAIEIQACDIVPQMMTRNARKYALSNVIFTCKDITTSPLPRVDLILCRTVLFHLSFANVRKALENFKASGSKYLLATTHPNQAVNEDIQDGNWRRLNLQAAPFNLPEPGSGFADGPGEDGYLALWVLAQCGGQNADVE